MIRVALPRQLALAQSLATPGDVLLYALLPLEAARLGLSPLELGTLLAGNRALRIALQPRLARHVAGQGAAAAARSGALLAAVAHGLAAASSGFATLLASRLLWGVAFSLLRQGAVLLGTSGAIGSYYRLAQVGALLALLLGPLGADTIGFVPTMVVAAALAGIGGLLRDHGPQHEAALAGAARLPASESADARAPRFAVLAGSFVADGLLAATLVSTVTSAAWAIGLLLALRRGAEVLLAPAMVRAAAAAGAARWLAFVLLAQCVGCVLVGSTFAPTAGAAAIFVAQGAGAALPLLAARQHGASAAGIPLWQDVGAAAGAWSGPLLVGMLEPSALFGALALLLLLSARREARRPASKAARSSAP